MKNKKQPSRGQATVLRQLVELIPAYVVSKLAREYGVAEQARTFSPWSHVVTLLYTQLSHAVSLNEVCDGLRLWATPLRALRGATPPARNTLSHANKIRDCRMAQRLFWAVLANLQATCPRFGQGAVRGMAWRFRRSIHVVDSTVIQLVASCVDWARHNRRKAAARCHLRLALRSMLPGFVVVSSARESELSQVRAVCAGLHAGEIVLFDRGYHFLAHFWELTQRGVCFVTRPLPAVGLKVVRRLPAAKDRRILKDELVVTTGRFVAGDYPQPLRRVTARVVVEGEERTMEFLTNNLTWSAASVAELYRCRWQIEAFFRKRSTPAGGSARHACL